MSVATIDLGHGPEEAMTAGELIELLKTVPPETPLACMSGVTVLEPFGGLKWSLDDAGKRMLEPDYSGEAPWSISEP